MVLRLGFPVVGVADLSRASIFWSAALGLENSPEWESGNWQTLRRRDGGDRLWAWA